MCGRERRNTWCVSTFPRGRKVQCGISKAWITHIRKKTHFVIRNVTLTNSWGWSLLSSNSTNGEPVTPAIGFLPVAVTVHDLRILIVWSRRWWNVFINWPFFFYLNYAVSLPEETVGQTVVRTGFLRTCRKFEITDIISTLVKSTIFLELIFKTSLTRAVVFLSR